MTHDKLPLIELTHRWIDNYTTLHYPEDVREKAHEIVIRNPVLHGFPHIMAATAVYIACKELDQKFDTRLAEAVSHGHRSYLNEKSGIKLKTVKGAVKLWKL